MRTPIAALTWEIWRRNRWTVWVVAAIVLSAWLFNLRFAEDFHASVSQQHQLLTINCLLTAASLLLVFAIFNYTEFNPQKEWTGFPYRLFALPVTAFTLIAVPMLLGISALGSKLRIMNVHTQKLIPVSVALLALLLVLRGLGLGIPYLSPNLATGMSCH